MALKLSTTVRNARLDAIETAIGTSPILKIRTGSAPADCGTSDSGTVLATLTLPSDWMAAAASGANQVRHLAGHQRRRHGHGGSLPHLRFRRVNVPPARDRHRNRRRRRSGSR